MLQNKNIRTEHFPVSPFWEKLESAYLYFYHSDHIGSSSFITDVNGNTTQHLQYLPFGETFVEQSSGAPYNTPYKFSAKEKDEETGYSYFGARYYMPEILNTWGSVDPMSDKYPNISPYAYCNWNPVMLVDPNGMEWVDGDGNKISEKQQKNIKVYIFYDPKAFEGQSKKMYKDTQSKYGKGTVAMSNVTTEKEFTQDWKDMGGKDIKEVNLNYHGNNQTLMLDSDHGEYITSTGDGKSNKSGTDATNVNDLPTPKGNISNAQLNINSCQANSHTQNSLKGQLGLTLAEGFLINTDFKTIRTTPKSVSYDWITKKPQPRFYGKFDYLSMPRSTFKQR